MKSVLLLLALVLSNSAMAAEEKDETAAECKKRLGSARACFESQANYHVLMCGLKLRLARSKAELGDQSAFEEYGKCGPTAKTTIRPYYDALMIAVSKKPAAAAAAKKSMQAFIAVMKEPPGSTALQNNLTTALAELELEAP